MNIAPPARHDHDARARAHDHVFLGADHDANARTTRAAAIITAVMMVAEIVAGQLYGSMALLADGVHMATHAAVLGVAAAAYAYSRREARNPRFSFGTGKIGDLAGFASALTLGMVAIGIGIESAVRLLHPGAVAFGEATVVAVVGLVVNLGCALLLGGGHAHAGNADGHDHEQGHDPAAHGHAHRHDNNLRSAYLHVLADALTSVLAIVALLAGRYLGWLWLDPAMGLVGALVIARWSVGLLRDTALVLVDASEPQLAAQVRAAIEADGDARVSDLHVWQVGPGAHAAIVALVAERPLAVSAYHARLAAFPGITHASIEVSRCDDADCTGRVVDTRADPSLPG